MKRAEEEYEDDDHPWGRLNRNRRKAPVTLLIDPQADGLLYSVTRLQARLNGKKGVESGLQLRWIVLAAFVLVYGFLCLSKHYRATSIWVGIGLMVLARYLLKGQDADGSLSVRYVFLGAINWNVIGILAGAMLLADRFIESRVPVLLADLIALRCRSAHMALLGVCVLSGFISIFVDNVTTVLIVAPVALVIAKRTNLSPVPFLVGLAISSNLQGAATLIGDPPSMLLAGHFKMTFNEFFFYRGDPIVTTEGIGRPSMFFVMQAGAVASFAVLYFIFRRHRHGMPPVEIEKPKSWGPTILIVVMVAFLASSSVFDPDFVWLAGTGNAVLGAAVLVGLWVRNPSESKKLLKRYDLPTILFLAGIFVMAKEMEMFGWVAAIASGIRALVGQNQFMAYTLIVWFSVLVSAFIDNIAYVALMLPVAGELAATIGGHPFLYAGGLLVGACLGGNITPIGAACNVVSVGILRREGHPISFWDFAKIGLPFTLAATVAGYLVLWAVWR